MVRGKGIGEIERRAKNYLQNREKGWIEKAQLYVAMAYDIGENASVECRYNNIYNVNIYKDRRGTAHIPQPLLQ